MSQFKFPVIDTTARDYLAIRDMLINLIPFFTPEWTNYNASDPGIALVELVSALSEKDNFIFEQIARDGGWETAISKASIIAQGTLINYNPRGPSSAVSTQQFILPSALPTNITIPSGTRVKTSGSNAVTFETTDDLTIPAGSLGDELDSSGLALYSVDVAEGETKSETLAPSDNTEFQKRTLTSVLTVDDTYSVYINEGGGEVLWAAAEDNSFVGYGDTDQRYTVFRDDDDYVTFTFGDNINGKIPASGATIRITYRELTTHRGNVTGNIGSNTLTVLLDSISYGGSLLVPTTYNTEPASGGELRETIEEAKKLGPASLSAMKRAVTADDYIYFSERYPGVARAGAADSEVCAEVEVTIVPEGGGTPSTALLNNLKDHLETKKCLGTIIQMSAPTYVSIEVEGTVQVDPAYSLETVQENTQLAIVRFFSATGTDVAFGRTVQISDFYALVDNQEGVQYINLTKFTREPQATLKIWTGNATFGTISITTSTIAEVWTVTFVTPTTFNVLGSVAGLQTATGVIGTEYTSDNSEIRFTITAGVNPQRAGDTATIRVSNLVGSVALDDGEFPELSTINNITFEGGI